MIHDLEMMEAVYAGLDSRIETARTVFNRPMTLAEKILCTHRSEERRVGERVCHRV